MKVSDLITDIVEEAEFRFGDSTFDHPNDCISVNLFPSGSSWQVNLQRPTKRQLENGELTDEALGTPMKYEYCTAFFVECPTLMEALNELFDVVCNAEKWPSLT
jgi:hypothetical protein